MAEFGSKARLSDISALKARLAKDADVCMSVLLECLSALLVYARKYCVQCVVKHVQLLANFLDELRINAVEGQLLNAESLILWVNDRLADMHVIIMEGCREEEWSNAKAAVSKNHSEFVQMVNYSQMKRNLSQQGELERLRAQLASLKGKENVPSGDCFPKIKGKQVCMKFLSNNGCGDNGEKCHDANRLHQVPDSLSKKAKEYLRDKFGGVRKDLNL